MPTGNENFQDAMLRHQVYLNRFAGSIRNEIFAILDEMRGPTRRAIMARISDIQGYDAESIRQLNLMLDEIKELRGEGWRAVRSIWDKELTGLAQYQPEFISKALETTMPVIVGAALPDKSRLREIITSRPFEGRTLSQWAAKIQRDDIARIDTEIKTGLAQRENAVQISRRIVGSVTDNKGGAVDISKRQAKSITLTAVNHTANQANAAFSEANSDIIDKEVILATLDTGTTPVCRSRDGDVHKVGEGPVPPFHYGCRTLRIFYVEPDDMMTRPANPATKRELIDEYNKKAGTSAKNRNSLPRGHKGKYDKFERERTRELVGQVPAKIKTESYWREQSSAFLNENMGVTRAKLFKEGKLTLKDFVDDTGRTLRLDELAQKHKSAFEAAGLNADNF